MVVGGTSPSSSSVEWALAELVCNPVILDKVQSELDQIVGRDCILKETDLPRLPYFQAWISLHPSHLVLFCHFQKLDMKSPEVFIVGCHPSISLQVDRDLYLLCLSKSESGRNIVAWNWCKSLSRVFPPWSIVMHDFTVQNIWHWGCVIISGSCEGNSASSPSNPLVTATHEYCSIPTGKLWAAWNDFCDC